MKSRENVKLWITSASKICEMLGLSKLILMRRLVKLKICLTDSLKT